MKNKRYFLLSFIIIIIVILLFVLKFNFAINTNETIKIEEPYVVEEYVDVEYKINDTSPYGVRECKRTTYNYSASFSYSYPIINNTILLLCNLNITNLEDKAGNFTFYIRIFKENFTIDYLDQTKEIKPNETAVFEWYDNVTSLEKLPTCEYKTKEIPKIEKCVYTPAGFYVRKEESKTVKELRNVTKYRQRELPRYEIKRMSFIEYLFYILTH